MAALGNLARDTAKRVEESGQAIWGTVKNFSLKNPNGTTYVSKPPGVIEKGFTGFLKGFVGRPLGWGLKVIDVTAAFFLTPVKWVASAPGAFFKAFPRFAPIATVAGGVMGIGSWLAHRRSAAMVGQYAQAQDMAMQAAAAQEAANTQAPVSYKNSASMPKWMQKLRRIARRA